MQFILEQKIQNINMQHIFLAMIAFKKSIKNLIKYTGDKELVLGYRKDYHSKINFLRWMLSKTLIILMQILTNTKIKIFMAHIYVKQNF